MPSAGKYGETTLRFSQHAGRKEAFNWKDRLRCSDMVLARNTDKKQHGQCLSPSPPYIFCESTSVVCCGSHVYKLVEPAICKLRILRFKRVTPVQFSMGQSFHQRAG